MPNGFWIVAFVTTCVMETFFWYLGIQMLGEGYGKGKGDDLWQGLFVMAAAICSTLYILHIQLGWFTQGAQ